MSLEIDLRCGGCGAGLHFTVPADTAPGTTLACEHCNAAVGDAYPMVCTTGCGAVGGLRVMPPGVLPPLRHGEDGQETTGYVCTACGPAYWQAIAEARQAALDAARARIVAGTFTADDLRLVMGGA